MVKKLMQKSRKRTSTARKTSSSSKPKVVKIGKEKITIKHPGAFGKYCRSHGYSSGCDPRCINSAMKSGNKTLQSRAKLAKALCNMNKKK